MSVTWGVLCVDCMEKAPRLGDGGFIGIPTLASSLSPAARWRIPRHVRNPLIFGAAYEALAGMGLLLQEAADYHAFLRLQDSHDLFLYNDHMEATALHPRLPGWDWAGVKQPVRSTTGVTGHVVIACPSCSDTVATSFALWYQRKKVDLEQDALDLFSSRILGSEPDNFCRQHPAISPDGDLVRVKQFLQRHTLHRLFSEVEARTWAERRPEVDDA